MATRIFGHMSICCGILVIEYEHGHEHEHEQGNDIGL